MSDATTSKINPLTYIGTGVVTQQKAQLSQRGRAMFRVVEYFAKSLKITQPFEITLHYIT